MSGSIRSPLIPDPTDMLGAPAQSSVLVAVFKAARPPFLLLAVISVLLGWASALQAGTGIDGWRLLLVLIGALLAHISVNALNEYDDFVSGLDLATRKTPFSGGSGALPANPAALQAVRMVGWLALAISIGIGLYLASQVGPVLLLVGAIGVLIIVTYTRWINRLPWLCLLAPGLGFGPLMVVGTHLALTGAVGLVTVVLSFIPFFMTSNLLLLNQYQDMVADRAHGRLTPPIAYGIRHCNQLYILFAVAAVLVLAGLVVSSQITVWALLALLVLPLIYRAWRGAVQADEVLGCSDSALAANVAAALVMPLLVALAILLA